MCNVIRTSISSEANGVGQLNHGSIHFPDAFRMAALFDEGAVGAVTFEIRRYQVHDGHDTEENLRRV